MFRRLKCWLSLWVFKMVSKAAFLSLINILYLSFPFPPSLILMCLYRVALYAVMCHNWINAETNSCSLKVNKACLKTDTFTIHTKTYIKAHTFPGKLQVLFAPSTAPGQLLKTHRAWALLHNIHLACYVLHGLIVGCHALFIYATLSPLEKLSFAWVFVCLYH